MEAIHKMNGQDRSVQFARLREVYDIAFRELVVETRLQQLRIQSPCTAALLPHRRKQFEEATLAVRYRRDMMADFLLMSVQTPLTDASLQEAAYFVWLNAGRPTGTSILDWFTAQRQLAEV